MEKLIDLSTTIEKPFARMLFSVFQQPIERFLSIHHINRHYFRYRERVIETPTKHAPFETVLETLNVRYDYDESVLGQIPASGPLVVVSNHPFGGLDGVILGAMMAKSRPDVRILGNYLLKQVDGLKEWIVAINPFDNRSPHFNLAGLKEAFLWLKRGGALIVFPAGEVASWNQRKHNVTDPEWSRHVAWLIRKTRSATLPVYFPGRNSTLFSMAGILSPKLRTLLLPRELVRKSDRCVPVHIGKTIPWSVLNKKEHDGELIDYLRTTTECLRYKTSKRKRFPDRNSGWFRWSCKGHEPLIAPVTSTTLRREIDALSSDQILVSSGSYAVYLARSTQIPNVLREIGRLREQTFRDVREGTGRSLDLDRFDVHYRHLFLYNRDTSEIIGGYRLGLVNEILDRFGIDGLYTNTLFRFKRSFFEPAVHMVELGRSFVRIEYQKKHNSMITIWKGIGEFLRRNPQYRILFGPVSIRNDYLEFSKRLMIRFLIQHHGEPIWSSRVKPRRPCHHCLRNYSKTIPGKRHAESIDDISHWISQVEPDGKGIPVLLKHYLKLNGKVLGFNIDGDFSEVIDSLIWVDLDAIDERIRKRLIGHPDS